MAGNDHRPPATEDLLLRRLRVIAGSFDGTRSPVATLSGTLCVDVELAAGARLALSGAEHEERALYVVSGEAALARLAQRPARHGGHSLGT